VLNRARTRVTDSQKRGSAASLYLAWTYRMTLE
jgi:hypothetical protein